MPRLTTAAARLAPVALAVLLAACAAQVRLQPAQLQPLQPLHQGPDLQLAQALAVPLATGYTRTLPASRWRAVGALPEGRVYQPLDTVFAIEGRNLHEAWLVVDQGLLHGFYLPAESAFSRLTPPLPLNQGAPR